MIIKNKIKIYIYIYKLFKTYLSSDNGFLCPLSLFILKLSKILFDSSMTSAKYY